MEVVSYERDTPVAVLPYWVLAESPIELLLRSLGTTCESVNPPSYGSNADFVDKQNCRCQHIPSPCKDQICLARKKSSGSARCSSSCESVNPTFYGLMPTPGIGVVGR